MTRDALVENINELIQVLLLNKEALGHGRLADLTEMLTKLQDPVVQEVLPLILGEKAASLTQGLVKLVEIEKRLLQPQQEGVPVLSDRLVASLAGLKNRPLVLLMIAGAL